MSDKIKTEIKNTTLDLVSKFLLYDRKEDEDLPRGEIQKAVASGIITIEEMVEIFEEELRVGLK